MRVGLVGQQPKRSTITLTMLPDQRLEHGIVASLTLGEQHPHRATRSVGQRMNLRGQPTSRPADCVIIGLAERLLVIRFSPFLPQETRPHADERARTSNR